jgi:hypothetical protein
LVSADGRSFAAARHHAAAGIPRRPEWQIDMPEMLRDKEKKT